MMRPTNYPALSEPTSFEDPFEHTRHPEFVDRISRVVTLGACLWVLVISAGVLLGWILVDDRMIHFPMSRRHGTTMPLTALGLLMCTAALWLVRTESNLSKLRRTLATAIATLLSAFGFLILLQYLTGLDLAMDVVLFPDAVAGILGGQPARPSIASAFSLMILGAALVLIDVKSKKLQFILELLVLLVAFIGLERAISYVMGEEGLTGAHWRLLVTPMPPKSATCIIALAVGVLYARPRRGLVDLLLASGPSGVVVRWLMPAAIFAPILFGWLGQFVMNVGFQGTQYPLSLVVSAMIVLLLVVTSFGARAIRRVELQRTRALKALAERERVLRAVFENAGTGIFMVDVKGRPIAINRTMANMLGYSIDELFTMPLNNLVHATDLAESYHLFQQILSGERDSYRSEKRYVHKDGSTFWVQVNTSVAFDADGRPEFVIGMVEDITERKEAEFAQRRLTAILDATPDFVGISDVHGHAVYLNRAGRKMAGIGDRDVTQMHIKDFHPPKTAEFVLKTAVPKAMRSGVWTGETELLGAEGQTIPVSQVILSHKDPNGHPAYISTISRDITERKRFEDGQRFLLEVNRVCADALETNKILSRVAALVVPTRADYCQIALLTKKCEVERAAVARFDAEQLRVRERIRSHRQGKVPSPVIEQVARTGKAALVSVVTDEWIASQAGSARHRALLSKLALRSFLAVPLRGQQVTGALCFAVVNAGRRFDKQDLDLAEKVAASIALALDNAALLRQSREAARIRDEVLRVVAHDLRNPLNTISLAAGFIREGWGSQLETQGNDKIALIERSIEQADHLIEDLLDVARMEGGQFFVESCPTEARALVLEAIELHESLAEQHKIQVRCEMPDERIYVQADRQRMLQVFSNLIGNALKFSPDGSEVVLRADRDHDKLRFEIQDHGPGIQEADFEKLFDPFWQARKGTGGAGLGLAISKAIVKAHGGKIWLESTVGRGSTFFFTLPLASAEPERSLAAD